MTTKMVFELPSTPEQPRGGYAVISFSNEDNYQTAKILMEFYGLAAEERAEAWLNQQHKDEFAPGGDVPPPQKSQMQTLY